MEPSFFPETRHVSRGYGLTVAPDWVEASGDELVSGEVCLQETNVREAIITVIEVKIFMILKWYD